MQRLNNDFKVNQGSIIDEYEKAINMMANAKLNQITEGNGQGMFNIVMIKPTSYKIPTTIMRLTITSAFLVSFAAICNPDAKPITAVAIAELLFALC